MSRKIVVNRITALSLVAALTIGQTQVLRAESNLAGVYENATGAGEWTDPGTGSSYYYGGNYTFKFKNTNTYTPWVQIAPPSAKIGCHGLSIKGGFLALLGLEDIKLQLQNAGALFAWGIMTSLEYTMPGIAAVFQKIQEWARKLQQLLQNSCQEGYKRGKESGFGRAVFDLADEVSGGGFSAISDWTQGLADKMDKIDELIDDPTGSSEKAPAKEKTRKYFEQGGSVSMLAMYFGKYLPDSTSKGFNEGSLSELYKNKKVGDVNLVGVDASWSQRVLLSKLTFLFFGDLALNKEGMSKLAGLFDGDGNIDVEKVRAFLKAVVTGVKESTSTGLVPIQPIIGTKDAARALLYGIKDIDSPNCGDGYCDVTNYKIAYMNFVASSPSKGEVVKNDGSSASVSSDPVAGATARVKGLVLTKEADAAAGDPLRINWGGFYDEGLKAIRYLSYQKTGLGSTYGWYSGNDSAVNLGSIKAPLMLPNIDKYISTIAIIEKKAGGENAYTIHLKEQLARVNAHFSAIAFAQGIYSLVTQLEGDTNSYFSPEATKILQGYHTRVYQISKNIEEAIREDMRNDDELRNIIAQYKEIERRIDKNILKIPGAR